MPVVELERLLLMREFQELLHQAQPERQWNLKVASSGPFVMAVGSQQSINMSEIFGSIGMEF